MEIIIDLHQNTLKGLMIRVYKIMWLSGHFTSSVNSTWMFHGCNISKSKSSYLKTSQSHESFYGLVEKKIHVSFLPHTTFPAGVTKPSSLTFTYMVKYKQILKYIINLAKI